MKASGIKEMSGRLWIESLPQAPAPPVTQPPEREPADPLAGPGNDFFFHT